MRFEKISKKAWTDYVSEIMTANNAPIDAIDATIDAWNEIKVPRRATAGSAGYDFYAPMDIIIPPGLNAVIPTGIKVNLDDPKEADEIINGVTVHHNAKTPYVLMVYPRSSLGFRFYMTLANTVGVIDQDYYNNEKNEGHILINCVNGLSLEGCPMKMVPDIRSGRQVPTIDMEAEETQSRFIKLARGTAFAQGVITRVYTTVDDSPVSEERTGGIGSTDSKQ